MKLFIIGNGFDLGHGLPTQYWDFRTFLENKYPDFLLAFEEHYNIYPGMTQKEKSELLWNEFETNLANIDEDIIIENCVGIDMDLESGDVGIEDTLFSYFSGEYRYIERLSKHIKQWIETIDISNLKRKSSVISNNALYVTFNYTNVLEEVYGISLSRIIHIHGSLGEYDSDPVLGHGNYERINKISEKRIESQNIFDEKMTSICRVVENYYRTTFKDVNQYSLKLSGLSQTYINEIIVIGHSLAGVDMQYFKEIDALTNNRAKWTVYYYKLSEKSKFVNNLIDVGIDRNRIVSASSSEFYDI